MRRPERRGRGCNLPVGLIELDIELGVRGDQRVDRREVRRDGVRIERVGNVEEPSR